MFKTCTFSYFLCWVFLPLCFKSRTNAGWLQRWVTETNLLHELAQLFWSCANVFFFLPCNDHWDTGFVISDLLWIYCMNRWYSSTDVQRPQHVWHHTLMCQTRLFLTEMHLSTDPVTFSEWRACPTPPPSWWPCPEVTWWPWCRGSCPHIWDWSRWPLPARS